MKWPPVPEGGRLPMVEGANATRINVVMVLSDLQDNPFAAPNLSLGDVTFKSAPVARGRIEAALGRLSAVVLVENVSDVTESAENIEDGQRQYLVEYTDRETRISSEVRING